MFTLRIDVSLFACVHHESRNRLCEDSSYPPDRALATQLLEMNTPGFVEHSKTVVANAGALAKALIAKGHKLAIGRTTNHLVLWIFVHKSGAVSVLVPFLFSMCITQYLESEKSLPMLCVYIVLSTCFGRTSNRWPSYS